MSVVEISGESVLTQRQRWSLYLALLAGAVMFLFGVNLRDTALNATTLYVDSQAGIQALYPKDWLIDTDGDYVFRVRDLTTAGFKTTIQVALQPSSADSASERNVLDALTLWRSQILPDYSIQSLESYRLPDGTNAIRVKYTYVATEANPFLENVPVVVRGLDIVVNRGGQVLVVSFQSDLSEYDQEYAVFERFLKTLDF